ncbi:Oligopeptide transporter 3 [Grifola frondosa]|uniref:Oligopeptide transporter 3 n=1 Tax=Grifola frondosa TaxID=5627 RepID=A0A1C7LLN2_GRIFR|nr:Oligopeptide transporter 3 [Grifola frondosa]
MVWENRYIHGNMMLLLFPLIMLSRHPIHWIGDKVELIREPFLPPSLILEHGRQGPQLQIDDNEKHLSDEDSIEKKAGDTVESIDDAQMSKEVEEFEERLQNDEASEPEYLVQEAYEVAVKVLFLSDSIICCRSTRIVLGLGFSAFGAYVHCNVSAIELSPNYSDQQRSGTDLLFKPQTLSVSTLFLLILSYWFGNGMHMILFVGSGGSYVYYNNQMNGGLAIFTLIGSQLLGYGYAGLLQDILVKPTKCFWPTTISTANLFQALHYDNQMTSKRVRLFWTVFSVMFQSCVPEYLWRRGTAHEGMGLLSWCFDWNLIGSACLYSPIWLQINQDIGIFFTYILMAGVYYGNLWRAKDFPFMSQAIFAEDGSQYNQTALLTNGKFDPVKYEQLGVSVSHSHTEIQSLTYMYTSSQLSSLQPTPSIFITSNLSLGATVTHVFFWNWQDLKPFILSLNPGTRLLKLFTTCPLSLREDEDVQADPALVYSSARMPLHKRRTTGALGLPWWALTVLLIISFTLCSLFATLAATIGFFEFNSSANGFFQMITAYLVPGEPVANMYGALYGQHPMSQAIAMLGDLKLGQYVKLAPRVTFSMQILGTVVGAILNCEWGCNLCGAALLTAARHYDGVDHRCEQGWYVLPQLCLQRSSGSRSTRCIALLSISGTRLWSGQNAQGYNSNAISWGGLAPQMFGAHSIYHMVPISLAIGVFLPLPFIAAWYIWPKAGFENFNTAIIMQYSCFLSVGINTSVNPSMVLGIFSQWWVRTRYPRWFTKYNYIMAAALDGGTQVISFLLNFVLLTQAVFGAAELLMPSHSGGVMCLKLNATYRV